MLLYSNVTSSTHSYLDIIIIFTFNLSTQLTIGKMDYHILAIYFISFCLFTLFRLSFLSSHRLFILFTYMLQNE